jgi:hypothetical protein
MVTSTTETEQNEMTKSQLRKEVKRYIAVGCSVELACEKVNNLYHMEYLFKIYEINQEMKVAA